MNEIDTLISFFVEFVFVQTLAGGAIFQSHQFEKEKWIRYFDFIDLKMRFTIAFGCCTNLRFFKACGLLHEF